MRKTLLTVAFILVAMVSCQDKTKEKMEDATEAVGTEMDTAVAKVDTTVTTAVDTLQSKTGKALEKGAEKMDKAAADLKKDAKK
jgi:hypothetical protein